MTTIAFESNSGRVITTEQLDIRVERVIIGSPSIRTVYKEVPGRDGVVDYTDYFGEADLSNRMITIYCGIVFREKSFQCDRITNELHGRKMKIRMSNDPGFYFEGRLFVSEFETVAKIGHFTIECDVFPWKLKEKVTSVSYDLVNTNYRTISLYNDRRTAIPKISVTGSVTMRFGSRTVSLSAGDHIVDGFSLPFGKTDIEAKSITPGGEIRFDYQEARL